MPYMNGVSRHRHVIKHLFRITALDNKQAFSYFVVRFLLKMWLNVSQIQRKYKEIFYGILTQFFPLTVELPGAAGKYRPQHDE
jgi:hypothetical protein